MKFLNERYAKVFSHKDFDICILRNTCPAKGDNFEYVIDAEQFAGRTFELMDDAINAIDTEY